MPLKKDPARGGTNKDGTKSHRYCSHCYANGEFTHPEINTAEKMQIMVKGKLKKMGFPGFIASFFARHIPELERWEKVN
jgi:hypothetical protein